jgi:uncharacterized protein YaaQ
MKLIVAILKNVDTDPVSNQLTDKGFLVTPIASSTGFLRQGQSMLMVGVEDDRVNEAIEMMNNCCSRTIEPYLRRATIYVLDLEHFERV